MCFVSFSVRSASADQGIDDGQCAVSAMPAGVKYMHVATGTCHSMFSTAMAKHWLSAAIRPPWVTLSGEQSILDTCKGLC